MKKILLMFPVLLPVLLHAQFTFSGSVYDAQSSQALPYATVILENTRFATTTNENGEFAFPRIKSGSYLLQVTYLGYASFEKTININGNMELKVLMNPKAVLEDEIIISAIRAKKLTPVTFSDIPFAAIENQNLGQDIPYLLSYTPSLVSTSDGGTGIGYTGLRIRGTDQSRINVTLNGIPLNDPESQAVFWVNLPDFASSVEQFQIQRGIGTSTNGAASFGASLNLQTTSLKDKPYGLISNSIGSFQTFKNSIQFGTGLIKDHFVIDGRLSRITTDGYIDRASANLRSYFLSAGWYDQNTILRINAFSGKEVTYQAWYGVYEADLEKNRRFNLAGTDFFSKEEPYDNEVDDYKQDHVQALFSQRLNEKINLNLGLHYTKGKGFFEQYKVSQSFSDYGLDNVLTGNDTIYSTDLIRRRWLDNDFYGTTFSLEYNQARKINLVFGGAWNQYDGGHFGEIIWAQFASNSEPGYRFYENDGLKTDFNVYGKLTFTIAKNFSLFGDIQYRNIGYSVSGNDIDQRLLYKDIDHHFINPKAGISYLIKDRNLLYASFARAHREPNRDDYIDAPEGRTPEYEVLNNLEAGYRFESPAFHLGINYYLMIYENQLILTGALNDVGTPIRTNVEASFRTGVELETSFHISKRIRLNLTATLSQNKIMEFTEFINTYDENYTPVDSLRISSIYKNTDISYSPEVIAAAILNYEPFDGFNIGLFNKYVGKQYLDNTSNEQRSIDAYLTNDILLTYRLEAPVLREILLSLQLNNITNRLYESNGYTYSERYVSYKTIGDGVEQILSDPVSYNYYYPQAGFHVLAGLNLKF